MPLSALQKSSCPIEKKKEIGLADEIVIQRPNSGYSLTRCKPWSETNARYRCAWLAVEPMTSNGKPTASKAKVYSRSGWPFAQKLVFRV